MTAEQTYSLRAEELSARPDDPWVRAQILARFTFCQRAGVIELELSQQKPEPREELRPRANLDFLPLYDLAPLTRRIDQVASHIRWFIPFPITATLATIVCCFRFGLCASTLGVVLSLLLWSPIRKLSRSLRVLKEKRLHAVSQIPCAPNAESLKSQRVNWWGLLNAGFKSHRFREEMEYPELRLNGNPWRVLIFGDLRIPVFKDREVTGRADAKPIDAYEVRMIAFCHLVERSMGGVSPYGVVLYGDSFEGDTIPRDAESSRMAFKAAIQSAREAIRLARSGGAVPGPEDTENPCIDCRHGKPFATTTVRRGRVLSLPVVEAVGEDGRTYHSTCGDRFRWLPPHAKALQKGLKI